MVKTLHTDRALKSLGCEWSMLRFLNTSYPFRGCEGSQGVSADAGVFAFAERKLGNIRAATMQRSRCLRLWDIGRKREGTFLRLNESRGELATCHKIQAGLCLAALRLTPQCLQIRWHRLRPRKLQRPWEISENQQKIQPSSYLILNFLSAQGLFFKGFWRFFVSDVF